MTAATVATASTVPVVQGGVNKKVTMTGVGAAMIEAANTAAQQVLLGITGGGAIGLGGFTLTVPATGTAALLGIANTFTAANIFSVNGAASTPALSVTGTPFTGGTGTTTKPLCLVETTGASSTAWNTAGTLVGINAATGFNGDILSLRSEGVNFFNFYYEQASGTCIFGPPASGFSFYTGQFYPYPVNSLRLGRPGVSAWTGLDLTSGAPLEWNTDTGLARSTAATVKVTNGGAGYGGIDANGYSASGTPGVTAGPFTAITGITIKNGLVTALTGS